MTVASEEVMGEEGREGEGGALAEDTRDALREWFAREGHGSMMRLAREAGCSHSTLSAVRDGRRYPSVTLLGRLVEAGALRIEVSAGDGGRGALGSCPTAENDNATKEGTTT